MAADYIEEREDNFFIRGSRVSLDSVVYGFLNGESPETIRDNFPTLSLEQVYGAVAYYLAHQAEMDSYLKTKQVTGAWDRFFHRAGCFDRCHAGFRCSGDGSPLRANSGFP